MPAVRSCILRALPIVALAAIFGSGDVLARETDKSWEFGAFAQISRYAGGTGIDPGTGFGVRGGYHFKAIHALEGTFDTVSADSSDGSVSYDITKYSLDYVRSIFVKGKDKWVPLASFGVGRIGVDDGNQAGNSTQWRAGGGFKYWIRPRGGFRFDVKIYRWHGRDVIPADPYFSVDFQFAATFLVGGAK